jgi:hypothetical protein
MTLLVGPTCPGYTSTNCATVPMEEIVRAFNWVIENGYVCSQNISVVLPLKFFIKGSLLGHLGVVCVRYRISSQSAVHHCI